jgi:hypothetical protein
MVLNVFHRFLLYGWIKRMLLLTELETKSTKTN